MVPTKKETARISCRINGQRKYLTQTVVAGTTLAEREELLRRACGTIAPARITDFRVIRVLT